MTRTKKLQNDDQQEVKTVKRKRASKKAKEAETEKPRTLHPKEVEECVRNVMRYNNITSIDQKDELLKIVKEQIGEQTEDIVIIRSFEMILDPLSIYK